MTGPHTTLTSEADGVGRHPCPRCNAPPGSPGRSRSGAVAGTYHTGRADRARRPPHRPRPGPAHACRAPPGEVRPQRSGTPAVRVPRMEEALSDAAVITALAAAKHIESAISELAHGHGLRQCRRIGDHLPSAPVRRSGMDPEIADARWDGEGRSEL
ncbi:zinc finger domain-containing protein [Streptomyces sp. CB02923]|uniref:zinc finger domain-containing protein n=1 Tax=Streptomyces sp. CB02923 TaxID=1718985 RepID=UPI003FD63848